MSKGGICKLCGGETCRLKIIRCSKCYFKSGGIRKSKEEMKIYKANYYQFNKEKIKNQRKNTIPTKNKVKQYNFKYWYGISLDYYNELLKQQNYSCLICGRKHNENNKKLHIDHNHKTNHVRGLLCFKCNIALGHFNDDIKLLKSAISYMENYDY